jgi:hypothetical protein
MADELELLAVASTTAISVIVILWHYFNVFQLLW